MQTYASISALLQEAWPNAGLTIAKNGQWQTINHPRGFSVPIQLTRKEVEMTDTDFLTHVVNPAVAKLRAEAVKG